MFQLMASPRPSSLQGLLLLAVALSLPAAPAAAATPPQARPVPQVETGASFDARRGLVPAAPAAASAAQLAAIDELRAATVELAVEIDSVTGATRKMQDYGGFLTPPDTARDAAVVGRSWVAGHASLLGLDAADFVGARESSLLRHEASGTTNLILQQTYAGLEVYNGLLHVNLDRQGRIVSVNNLFLPRLATALNTTSPELDATAAIHAAAGHLGTPAGAVEDLEAAGDPATYRRLTAPALALSPIDAQLEILPVGAGEARLVWNFQIESRDTLHWYDMNVDAVDGRVWTRFDWIQSDSYRVYPIPAEGPHVVGRSLLVDPALDYPAASPFAWHDTNGAAGAEFTTTQGNNAHAYTDTNADNLPDAGSSPDGGAGLAFDFAIDLGQQPSTYRPAAVTNLFYWNNLLHDVPYAYGFDEAGGNFQVNNYGNGGLGGDAVNAEAQDGAGTNNANFGTPPDGQQPRMQMFVWTSSSPQRDGDLDATIIAHEYGHGISNRLVGGPANVSCLSNNQQPGEGLSDWWALFMTQPDGLDRHRGIATYSLGQPVTGMGLRNDFYDGDPAVNPEPEENVWTYQTINAGSIPHGVGTRWTQAYWQVTWALIDAHGYNPDFDAYTGTSADDGNIRAMYYIIQGLKNTICSPAFTDVRDGVIAAAASAYEGEDVCRIWSAFAEFGLGSNAISSNPDSTTVTNGFAIPTSCDFLFAGPTAQTICAGAPVEYNLRAGTSYTPPVNLVLTGNPAGTTANFTVNPILAVPGLSHLTVGNTAAVPTGLYNMTLTANGDAVNAQALALQVYNGPPAAPTLTAPADGATGAALRPTFQWTATGAQSYVLEIDDNADFSSPVYTSPVLTTTSHQIDFDLPGLTQHFWRVRGTNLCSVGPNSPVFDFTTLLAPDQCAPGSAPFLTGFQGWENGLAGWTTSGTGNTWALSTENPHSGLNSFHAVDPATASDQRLLSPAIQVPATAPKLVFWNVQEFEDPTGSGGCWDGGIIEVSTNNGASFTQLLNPVLSDPYDGTLATGPNPLGGLPAWCSIAQPMSVTAVDLAAYAGQTIRVRFRLGSDGAAGNDGWWLDDIAVQSCTTNLIFNDGFFTSDTTRWTATAP